jgi:hypothetical protein
VAFKVHMFKILNIILMDEQAEAYQGITALLL